MNNQHELCIGMAGAGRATELHMEALKRFSGIPLCYKRIIARREDQVKKMQERFGFLEYSLKFEDLLNDPEIDVIDVCTPPLSGYFGEDGDCTPIGKCVSKVKMYERLLTSLDHLKDCVEKSKKKFCYAENFIYAPAVTKAAEIITAKKSKILFSKGEESLKGSSSPVAGEWAKTGGGTFIRTGAHPLSAIIWLKQIEAKARNEKISVQSVFADMAQITPSLNDYEHRHIAARPNDVEDFGTVIITFSDGTKAVVMATDTLLGGSRNYVELYCNDAVINCKLTMSDLMSTYFLDEDGLDDVYISEMLPSKKGWNNPFLEDVIMRGYVDEMRDFMESIYYNREPKSDYWVAHETLRVIYAAYKSAELGKAVVL